MALAEPAYPTKMTVRMLIMRAIRERLAQITKAKGFATDLGVNLFYGQQTTAEPHILPITYYWDHFENPEPKSGSQLNQVQIQIETFERLTVPEDEQLLIAEPVSAAQQMPIICNLHLADLKVGLSHDPQTGQYDTRLGGLAHGLAYLESDPFFGVQPAALLWGGLNSHWVITYQHAPGDPYAMKRA